MRPRKIKVCWISSARYCQPLDATSARKWDLLAGARNFEFHVLGFAASLRPRRFVAGAHFTLLPQPPTSPLRYLVMFMLAPPLLLALVLRHRARLIVAQSPFEGAIGAAVKLASRPFGLRPRLIVENHNNFEEDLFLQRRIPLPQLYRRLMLGAARFAFHHADALRVISSSTAERARHYAPALQQARFMTFSDTDIFRRAARSVAVEEALDIVYAGVLIPRKGVHHLLNAFARLRQPQARLHLIGGAENADYSAALRRQAAELGIEARVHFAGAVSQAELARRLAAARVMVLPSRSEGLGRVVVEAMLTGMPVIGSRVGGIPDLIRHGENGYLVAPGDEDDLLAALERIYAADVADMGAAARQFALGYFSPEQYAAGYRELFALALGERENARAKAADERAP